MTGTAEAVAAPAAGRPPRTLLRTAIAPLAVAAGTAALAVAAVLPAWVSRLTAPQYPKGLWLWVYGGRVEGDVAEINGLNHYIGMRTIDLTSVPELALWPFLVVASGALLVVAVFRSGWIGRLAALGLWLVPIGVLADIQRWLIVFGTNLDPTAALRLEPFVPLVVGPTKVWNFTIWTFPGPALVLILAAALVATLARRAPQPAVPFRVVAAVAAVGILMALTFAVAVPALRPPASAGTGAGNLADRPPPGGSFDLEAELAKAPAGATVVVPAGTYRGNFVLARPVTLVAGGEAYLDGGGRGTVVTVTAAGTTIRGFRVANSGGQVEEGAGIKVLADDVSIEENRIENAYTPVSVQGVSRVRIVDNTILGIGQEAAGVEHAAGGDGAPGTGGPASGAATPVPGASPDPHAGHAPGAGPGRQGDAISLWDVEGALVRGNTVEKVRDGIYLSYVDDVLIDGNTVRRSRYAVHAMFGRGQVLFGNTFADDLSGIVLMYTQEVTAGRNMITDCRSPGTGFGILLKDVRGVRLAENVVARNMIGLKAEGTAQGADAEAVVTRNRFAANRVGVALMASPDLSFGGNAFDGNLTQVLALEPGVERHNLWSYHGLGNAWSDYAGYDVAADGVGDVPHLSGGSAQALMIGAPALEALRTSPAFRVLEASQAWWDAGRAPIVVDTGPLTVDLAPPPVAGRAADGPAGWYLAGALLSLLPLAVMARLRAMPAPGRRAGAR